MYVSLNIPIISLILNYIFIDDFLSDYFSMEFQGLPDPNITNTKAIRICEWLYMCGSLLFKQVVDVLSELLHQLFE